MKNRLTVLMVIFLFFNCSELQKVIHSTSRGTISQDQIANGLKEALNKGVKNQVSKLAETNGFYKNDLVKITLPKELQKVDDALRKIGLSNLADKGLTSLNRAAENAVKEAIPIFVDAIKNMSFSDAKNILLGDKNAATQYLQNTTSNTLLNKFKPVINQSFAKVGANQIWSQVINKYNTIPFVSKVNPNLSDYVANEALKGVFKMIEVEEKGIREKIGLRTSPLLRQVFALQDK